MRCNQYHIYLDMDEEGRHLQTCRRLTYTIYWTNHSMYFFPFLDSLPKYKFMFPILYMFFLFLLSKHFCMDAGGFINKVNTYLIRFNQEGELQ